jgi:phosphoribosylamine--glycine ligase
MTVPADTDRVTIFHAGTKCSADGALVTAGGRVVAATAVAATFAAARAASADAAAAVRFAGAQHRRDIGWREQTRAG